MTLWGYTGQPQIVHRFGRRISTPHFL